MNGRWTPGTTVFWILIRVQKQIIYSTSSYWTAAIFQAQCWTLGVLRWFRFLSCPLRYSQWSRRDRYLQQMCIFHTSTSWTQFKGGMAVIAPTSGRTLELFLTSLSPNSFVSCGSLQFHLFFYFSIATNWEYHYLVATSMVYHFPFKHNSTLQR